MTYYSRRQLEALGEPLGDSITRKEGGRTIYGGGGSGGGGPSQTTTYSTNIPEYARPFVENMLESTQKQIYNEDMTGFRPYKPYSSNVENYFAGFSPLQQQAQQATGQLQVPGQIGAGSNLVGTAGQGALGAHGYGQQLGQQALGYGGAAAGMSGMGFGAGQRFEQMATSPGAQAAYMSPYMQNVVDYQKSQAIRDYDIASQGRNAAAVRAGAFGGSRQAVAEGEANRALMSQLGGIQATGTQKAFEDAQRQMQFGSQLGLQGLQAGYQGLGMGLQGVGQATQAGQYGLQGLQQAAQAGLGLGQLGSQQLAAQKDIIGLQSQMGAQQQSAEQQKINQAIQDYAIKQQYPMMQLGMMNAMLRGLPLQTQTTQLYQAQPTTLQQGIGLIGAGSTLFGGRAAGGVIKEYREGGITEGYKYGGAISDPELEAMAEKLSVAQLQERLRDPALTPGERQIFAEALQEKQQEKARMSGIAMAGGPAFESQGLAGGGIIAFDNGGLSMANPEFGGGDSTMDQLRMEELQLQKDLQQYEFLKEASPVAAQRMLEQNAMLRAKVAPPAAPTAAPAPAAPKPPAAAPEGGAPVDRGIAALTGVKSLEQQMAEQERLMGPNTANEGLSAKIAERLAGMSKREKQDELAAIRNAFIKFGTEASPGGIGVAALKGIGTYGEASDAARKAREGVDLELTKMQADIKKAERAEKRGNLDAAAKAYESAENRQLRIAEMQNQLKVAGISASRPGEFEKMFALFEKDPAAFEQFMAARDVNRGNLATATKSILEAKYPNYKLIAMTPPEKRTKEQNQFLQDAYKDAEATARDMMRKGTSTPTAPTTIKFDKDGNPVKG
jgi:hypothetical protein